MPPKGRGRKRPSAADFVEAIREEVEQSMVAEHAVVGAFRELASTTLSLDAMQSLPSRVVEVYMSAKFDHRLVSFIKHNWTGLSVLPSSLRDETVAKISGLSVSEASKLSYSLHIQDLIAYYFLKVPRY